VWDFDDRQTYCDRYAPGVTVLICDFHRESHHHKTFGHITNIQRTTTLGDEYLGSKR